MSAFGSDARGRRCILNKSAPSDSRVGSAPQDPRNLRLAPTYGGRWADELWCQYHGGLSPLRPLTLACAIAVDAGPISRSLLALKNNILPESPGAHIQFAHLSLSSQVIRVD